MVTHIDLKKRKREFLAMIGLTLKEFKRVLPAFTQAYDRLLEREQKQKRPKRKGNPGAGRPEKLAGTEQKLLFVLVYLKTYTLQVVLGQLFDMSQGTANTWVQRLLPVLREALDELGYLPERKGPELAATQRGRRGTREYVIDGTERRRQRPKGAEKQAIHYSGKKRLHTDKNIVVCQTGTQRVVYLSPTYPGTVHDKKLADHEQIAFPKTAILHKDTGFQGYEPDVHQPSSSRSQSS